MDLKSIKTRVLENLKKVKAILRETWSLPFAKLYFALAIVMTLFFLFVTFPYEVLIRSQLQKLESTIGRNIQIGVIDFSLIGDTYIDNISIGFSSGAELNLKEITLDLALNPYTLLLKKTMRGELSISGFKYARQEIGFNTACKSDFDIRLDPKSGLPGDGFLNIDLSNVYLKGITIKGFDIPPVRFTSIKGAASIRNRRLTVQNLTFSGKDILGEIKGSIQFEQMAGASRLNLFAYINSDSKILQEYRMLLENMLSIEGDKIKIEIGGSFANPDVKLPMKSGGRGAGKHEAGEEAEGEVGNVGKAEEKSPRQTRRFGPVRARNGEPEDEGEPKI